MSSLTDDWRMNCIGLGSKGRYLLVSGLWSDCKLVLETGDDKTIFSGHKMILAMASPFFADAYFQHQDADEDTEPTPVPVSDPVIFQHLMNYIYTDEMSIKSAEVSCALGRAAHKLQMHQLVKECVLYLNSNMSPENACCIYEFATLINDADLIKKSMNIICRYTCKVLISDSFNDIEVSTLETIFKQEALNISSEVDLCNAIIRYYNAQLFKKAASNDNSSPASLRVAVQHIRFLTLSAQEFSQGPGQSNLLTSNESLTVLMYLTSTDVNVPMPDGFTTLKIPRQKVELDIEEIIESELDKKPIKNEEENICTCMADLQTQNKYEEKFSIYNKVISTLKLDISDRDLENTLLSNKIVKLIEDEEVLKKKSQDQIESIKKLKNELKLSYCGFRCPRTFSDIRQWNCDNHMKHRNFCEVTFKLNEAAILLGIQIPTQSQANVQRVLYEENVEISLNLHKNDKLFHCTLRRHIPYNTLHDVYFKEPIKLKINEVYKIRVDLNVNGKYPIAETGVVEENAKVFSVSFQCGTSEQNTRAGFVRGLIFNT